MDPNLVIAMGRKMARNDEPGQSYEQYREDLVVAVVLGCMMVISVVTAGILAGAPGPAVALILWLPFGYFALEIVGKFSLMREHAAEREQIEHDDREQDREIPRI